jgi:hypothetical protein
MSGGGVHPVSFVQEARLLAEEAALYGAPRPSPTEYPIAIRISDSLDKPALISALNAVVGRHQALRTRYALTPRYSAADRRVMRSLFLRRGLFVPGFFVQHVEPLDEAVVAFTVDTDRQLSLSQRMTRFAVSAARLPLDWTKAAFRASVVTLENDAHLLVLVVSHLTLDGWSAGIIRRELIETYNGLREGRPPRALPHAAGHAVDFVRYEREEFRKRRLEHAATYWNRQWSTLNGALLDRTQLPCSTCALGVEPVVDTRTVRLDGADAVRINAACARLQVTPYVFVRAVFSLLLHGYTGRTRVAIWSNFANRAATGALSWVANCATHHLIPTSVRDETVADYCRHHQAELREAQRYEQLALPALPLFTSRRYHPGNVRVVFDTWPEPLERRASGASEFPVPEGRAWVDLDIRLQASRQSLALQATFNTARHSPEGVEALLCDLHSLLLEAEGSLDQPATSLKTRAARRAA